ncbi:lyase [uncultured archaeon]|nr:lyase [uncultured archaeon]
MGYDGIITPILTPFKKDGNIDYDATSELLDFLKATGVSGAFPLGSTGLFPWLSTAEKKDFISHIVEHSGKMKVIAGVGSSNVNESVELSQHAKDSGADASVLMPTYYIMPSQKWILKQFRDVLGTNDMPFFIYNIPQLAGAWIENETMNELKNGYSNIVGAKESSGDMRYFSRLVDMRDNNFDVFQGQDDLLLASMSLGASGGVCGLSNFSASVTGLLSHYVSGDKNAALEIQMKIINPLIKAINIPQFPTGYYYAFYKKFGIDGGYRSPMVPPSDHEMKLIDSELERAERLLQRYK